MEENRYMAKMRVHELAKELNIKSQDIIELLSTTDYAVKSASSGIEDAAQTVVRNKFSKKEDTKPAAKAEKAVKYHHDGFISWSEAGYSDNQKGCYELQKNYHNEESDHLQD